jgi:hypothetical protein
MNDSFNFKYFYKFIQNKSNKKFKKSTNQQLPTSCHPKTKSKLNLISFRIKTDLEKWMKEEFQTLEGISEWCKGKQIF